MVAVDVDDGITGPGDGVLLDAQRGLGFVLADAEILG